MLNEKQIKLLHNFFSGIGNKYGALCIDDIDLDNIDSCLSNVCREDLLKSIFQMQDRRFIIINNTVFTTQKPQTDLMSIFNSYNDYEKPNNIKYSDVKDYIDIENLPVSKSLSNLKDYCIEKSKLEDKIEKAYRFNWTFYFAANGIGIGDFDKISPFVSQYFEIEDNRDLKCLCLDALNNQVSWMCAGKKSTERKNSSWTKVAAKELSCDILDIYNIQKFCQSVSNFYGYILIKDAYRIFKSLNTNFEKISKEQFSSVCNYASQEFSIYQVEGAIVSSFLLEKRTLKYWSDQTKNNFIAEEKNRTEDDTLFLSILLLIKEQAKKQFFVPSETLLYSYANIAYVKPTTAYNKLIEIISENNEDFNLIKFNTDFNFFANMVCENMPLLRSDTLDAFGINKLDEAQRMQAIKYLEISMKEVPCWALRGLSQKDLDNN